MKRDDKRIAGYVLFSIGIYLCGWSTGAELYDWVILGITFIILSIYIFSDEDKLSDKRYKVVPYFEEKKRSKKK